MFDSVLRDELGGGRNLDALMGKARASEALKKFPVTVETVNEIIVMHPNFALAQAEKARTLMMITDWEQFIEVVQRVLASDERNFFALQAYIFYLLAQDGNIELGCEKLKFLNGTLEKNEPNNADVFFKCAQLFSRISGRDPDILKVTLSMIDKALKIRPLEADFAIEKAYHFLMMGDVQGAFNQYQEAAALDESKIDPLTGMIQCRLLQGMIDDAEQQIEFVNEIQVSVGKTPEMAFLEAMLNCRRPNMDAETKISSVIRYLDESLKLQIAQTKALNQDYSFYIKLNPDFLLSLSKEYFQFLNLDLGKKVEVVPEYVRKGNRLLEIIKKQIPGLLPAHLLLAKGKLGAGDAEAALKHIERVLEINPRHEEANVLYALISFKNGNVRNAKNALEEAVANNFQIRENPYFLMIKGEIELQSQDNEAALATLEAAYSLPIVKTGKPGRGKKADPKVASQMLSFTDKERCKLHVLLAKAYIVNGRVTDAKNVMDEAIKNFSGTAEEGTVLMTNAELSVASGDIKKALSILKAVDKTSQYFVDAKKLMAEIYLTNLLDRRHYAQCYMELIEANPTYENYKLLGDAFMAVQEPEDAGEAYKQALQLNPSDSDLIRKIGNALIATHDYNQAMAFYEQLLQDQPERLDLKLDMGKLCIQLNKFDRADKFLRMDVFGDEYGAGTLQALKTNVEGLLSIAKLHQKRAGKSNNPNPAMREAYQKAISMQGNVIEATKQVGGNADEERRVLSDINYELGKYLSTYEKNYELALQYFESAFKYNQASEKILSSMADIHMKQGDLEGAEMRTIQVLKLNPYNQSACFMIADLMMIKGEPIKAIKQYLRVLEYKSGDFTLVSKLIELMYRTGKLTEANEILEKIQKQCPNPNDSGLCYCKGLYQKYSRNPQEALKEFFKAKRGSQFAEDSIIQMVDLYLNPDQDVMFSTIGEGGVKQVDAENLRAADNLIKEMKSRGSGLKGSISETYVLMFQKGKMDAANKRLVDLLSKSPNYVPALVAQALTKLMNGKKDDAKKLLIMTTKEVFSFEYSEDLEKGWLMLADMLIQVIVVVKR